MGSYQVFYAADDAVLPRVVIVDGPGHKRRTTLGSVEAKDDGKNMTVLI